MNEEIIISTESVKVSELQNREKQIYDWAYKRGYKDGYAKNSEAGVSGFILFMASVALFLFSLLR